MNILKNVGLTGQIAYALVVIGALNWGLVGFFDFDLVAAIFGTISMLTRVVYSLVGLAALYSIFSMFYPSKSH